MQQIFIPRDRLTIQSARSSGPGGQHVNKTESKIEIRFHVDTADWIPEEVRRRFKQQNASKITKEGEFVTSSQVHRKQQRNLEECLAKLQALLDVAAVPPKARKATRPTRSSKERRLKEKKIKSERKSYRRDRYD